MKNILWLNETFVMLCVCVCEIYYLQLLASLSVMKTYDGIGMFIYSLVEG